MLAGKRRIRRAAIRCGLPVDTLTSDARATMIGSSSVLIEGQQGVVELGGSCIRLRTSLGVMSVVGSALELRELSADSALITGERIVTLTYGKAAQPQ